MLKTALQVSCFFIWVFFLLGKLLMLFKFMLHGTKTQNVGERVGLWIHQINNNSFMVVSVFWRILLYMLRSKHYSCAYNESLAKVVSLMWNYDRIPKVVSNFSMPKVQLFLLFLGRLNIVSTSLALFLCVGFVRSLKLKWKMLII